jgi:allantoin racemase
MRILIVNPNSSASMTRKIYASTVQLVAAGTEIEATNPLTSPASIEGHYDGAMALPGLVREIQKGETKGFDGYVVACFDDPGIGACREVATGPVIGICEAAMQAASIIATCFSVVTTLTRAIPIIEELALRYGMRDRCRRVHAAGIPVLALEDPASGAREKVRSVIQKAVTQDRCEAVILGCAGMTDLTHWLTAETGMPVIDGVSAAVKIIEGLVGIGLQTSKVGAYAPPLSK